MVSNYAFCESKADLAKLVVARVKEVFDGEVDSFGTIDFKVEDTPKPLEASKMGEKELERAYDIAAATYGITTVRLFDNDGVQLVFGYYGGTEGIQAVYFDDSYELDEDDAFDRILNAINLQLSFEIPQLCGNFLVKISD
jgi:hypothetical protein